MIEEFSAAHSKGHRAYSQGLYREAADRYEEAFRIAHAYDRSDLAFSSAVEAGGSWHLGGNPLRGLSLILDALAHVPPDAACRDIWQAKLRSFELMRCFRPDLPFLESCLSDLRVLARQQGMNESADVLRLEALLYRARGLHEQAIERFERAWSHVATFGFHPYLIAYGAIFSALVLRNLSAVQHWSQVLHRMGANTLEGQAAWYESQARVGLYANEPGRVSPMVNDLESLVVRTQQPIWQRRVVMLKVRSWLVDSAQGDPMDLGHPLWRTLSQRIEGTPEIFDEYDRVLLLVDARLAGLRYELGVTPVDDLYYRAPQELGSQGPARHTDSDEIGRRAQLCRWALKRAAPIAIKLDAAFHCAWRQAELEERRARVAELIEWYRKASHY